MKTNTLFDLLFSLFSGVVVIVKQGLEIGVLAMGDVLEQGFGLWLGLEDGPGFGLG